MSKSKIIFNLSSTSDIVLTNYDEDDDVYIANEGVHTIDYPTNNDFPLVDINILEARGGHTLNVISKSAAIEHIIATDGTINFDYYPSGISTLTIEIGSQGIVNHTGAELPIEEIIISSGAQFECVIEKNQYKIEANNYIKFDSIDLKNLVQATDFMYNKFADQKDIIINYDDIADLKVYHKLCRKLGKDTVHNFMESKKALVNMDDIQKNAEVIESIQVIDFNNIENFINDNYFELVGIAKNPLKTGFDGKFGVATEILTEIFSFLDLNDVIAQTILPEEDIDVTGNIEEDIL